MEVAVYDTYVVKKDGQKMHFDVIVPRETPHERALEFGRAYLKTVGQAGQPLTAKECEFCHVEEASKKIELAIQATGCYISEMEGCR